MGRKKSPDRAIQVRFSDPIFEVLEDIRREQPKIPTLSETVRRLVDLGLKASRPPSSAREQST
jgi:hypothetical protein